MCDSDKPIFKVEEAILNYAEAACELGQFDQAAADISINRLRKRAGVADMEVAKIDASFDPNRDKGNNPHWSGEMPDYEVEPLLWEIRRERIVELMGKVLVSMMYVGGPKHLISSTVRKKACGGVWTILSIRPTPMVS